MNGSECLMRREREAYRIRILLRTTLSRNFTIKAVNGMVNLRSKDVNHHDREESIQICRCGGGWWWRKNPYLEHLLLTFRRSPHRITRPHPTADFCSTRSTTNKVNARFVFFRPIAGDIGVFICGGGDEGCDGRFGGNLETGGEFLPSDVEERMEGTLIAKYFFIPPFLGVSSSMRMCMRSGF